MNVHRIRRRKLFFFLLTLATFFTLLLWVKNLLVSSLLAFVGANLLAPFVDDMERRGMHRKMAVIIPFAAASLLLFLVAKALLPSLTIQVSTLQQDVPHYIDSTQRLTGQLRDHLSNYIPADTATHLSAEIESKVTIWLRNLVDTLPEHVSNSLTVLFLAPFLCFFMLLDGRTLVRQFLAIVPNQFFELALNLQHDISDQMGGFIRARLLESMIVGMIVATGLIIIGFKYTLVLAIAAALLNLIPYLGPVVGALPAFAIAALNGGTSSEFVALLLIYLGAQAIDAVVILPWLVARIVNLHPVTVVLSIIVGSQLMGVLGMIISIPVASALQVTLSALYQHLTQFRDG